MDLARFMQIRPVQAGNSFELVKLHFRLEVPESGADFIEKAKSLTFARQCDEALEYLKSDHVIARANECMQRLSEGNQVEDLGSSISIELPSKDVLVYAYKCCFAFPNLTDDHGMMLPEYSGDMVDHAASLEARFPEKLLVDLIALYINPGVMNEYRSWLSMLLRICHILESEFSINDIVVGLQNVKGRKGLLLAEPGTREYAARRFFQGRVLMPSQFKADIPPKMAPVLPDQADGLHSSRPMGQIRSQIDGKTIPARDYDLEKVEDIGIDLTKPGKEFPTLPPLEDREHQIVGEIPVAQVETELGDKK